MAQPALETVAPDELAALKAIASMQLEGDGPVLTGVVTLSCAGLAERLQVSQQTASRRLRSLDEAGLITRKTVPGGQHVSITDDGEALLRREYDLYRRIFDEPVLLELIGNVTTGLGEGKHYISLDGYQRQFRSKLGYEPYPGTLNLELTEDSQHRRPSLEAFSPVHIAGWSDDDRTYGPANCYPVVVESSLSETFEQAHLIVPERTHHDDTQIEVIAPVGLRETLDLTDGDHVLVRVGDRQ